MKHYLSCLVFLSVFLLGPGCGGGDVTLNGAEVAEGIFGEFCAAGADCGILTPGEIEICTDVNVQGFCQDGGLCGESYTMPADDWDACLDAIAGSSCVAVEQLIIPSECQTIEALQ